MMKVSTLTHYVGSGAIIGVGIVFYRNPDPGQKDPPRWKETHPGYSEAKSSFHDHSCYSLGKHIV